MNCTDYAEKFRELTVLKGVINFYEAKLGGAEFFSYKFENGYTLDIEVQLGTDFLCQINDQKRIKIIKFEKVKELIKRVNDAPAVHEVEYFGKKVKKYLQSYTRYPEQKLGRYVYKSDNGRPILIIYVGGVYICNVIGKNLIRREEVLFSSKEVKELLEYELL